jgi:DtxR family Mn-dependent transcriptional regulator
MTISEQDYLKTIYERGGANHLISNKTLSEALGLSPPSVSEMVKRLTSRGFIAYEPYKGIRLTDKGIEKALQVIRRHQLWEVWLTKELGYPLHMVHEEAERLEHAMSEELENRLFEYLGSPTHGAMGEIILTAGHISEGQSSSPLNECETGKKFIVSWIEDDSELLKYLETLGLQPRDELMIIEKAPFQGPVTVEKNKEKLVIGYLASSKIHMTLSTNIGK